MKRLCVYCGSSTGKSEDYTDAARALAETLIQCNIELVFGGSSTGTMGLLADAVLAGGGTVHGVIPRSLLEKEVAHPGLTEMHVVESMHARKAKMAMLSDGFIALPGGFLNVNGYFNHLLSFLDHAEAEGFVRTAHRAMLLVSEKPGGLIRRFESYVPPAVDKWI
jgi:predicted Rossmann-fold nucleotide-binding protein